MFKLNQLLSEQARTGNMSNKLHIYKLYNKDYWEELYLRTHTNRGHRSAFAKFKCGVGLLRAETGWHDNILFENILCFNCLDTVEDAIYTRATFF